MISYSKLKNCFLDKSLDDNQVVKCLRELSEAFTQKREKIELLYKSKKHISSYAAFYLPTNMYKMEFLLGMLSDEVISSIEDSTIVEVGTGPGTYIFAMLSVLDKISSSSFIGVDHCPLMLEQARVIHRAVYPKADISWCSSIPSISNKKTFIFGNSLNEMGPQTAMKIIKDHKVETVICIEPGTKSSFAQMSKFRELMIKSDYNVLYPCASNSPCPIVDVEDDWCHQVVRTKLDESILRISQMAKLDRKTMPAIIHVYSRNFSSNLHGARIIRLVRSVKHAFIWELCESTATGHKVFRVEAPKKQFKKKELKELEKMSAGLEIKYEIDRELDENYFRVKNVVVSY